MKKVFINTIVKSQPNYEEINRLIENLNFNNIVLCYSNQFSEIAKKINNKKIILKMQVLGCSNPSFPKKTEAIIIIGQGKFHSVSLAYESKLPTYILENSKLTEIPKGEIEKLEKREKGALLKYLNSKKIGILITTKPGQERLKQAVEFKKKLKKKKSYLFIGNNIDVLEFENFPIDCWVNTACPRMDLNHTSIINLDKIPKEFIK